MLRRSEPSLVKMRNRKKWPYMIHHNKLPWNTVEPGTDLSHKILSSCFLTLLTSAANMRINGLVLPNEQLPQIPEDQWLFTLPSSTFVVPLKTKSLQQQKLVATTSSENEGEEATIEFDDESTTTTTSPLAPFGWFGKRVVDELSLTHYGPIHANIAPVKEVAEFRSPDLRLVCNAIKFSGFHPQFLISQNSSFASSSSSSSNSNPFVIYHFYRPNRAPSEMQAAFKQFEKTSSMERPDLSALEEVVAKGASFKPIFSRKPNNSNNTNKVVVSPMPIGEVPTSPQYGLIEREAIRPGDAFGCRSRAWGHHW